MENPKKILAISGSTRQKSSNNDLIQALIRLSPHHITIFKGIDELPHFNPDLDIEPAPEKIAAFRQQLREADAILICTPEYAMGVPGTLKNAIDWIVSSCEFSHKPTALITASSLGQKAHASLLETLKIIETRITDDTQLVISHIKTKISFNGEITDVITLESVKKVLLALDTLITPP